MAKIEGFNGRIIKGCPRLDRNEFLACLCIRNMIDKGRGYLSISRLFKDRLFLLQLRELVACVALTSCIQLKLLTLICILFDSLQCSTCLNTTAIFIVEV